MAPFSMAAAAALWQRLKPFWALSRTPHGLIDMAAPALAALLCLGHVPPLPIVIVGVITMFAGYTAVYALNDLVDLHTDKEKVRIGGYSDQENYLDGVLIRHPMAQGTLSLNAGLAWTAGWSLIALAGAYWLNPICLYIFIAGCLLEAIYCLLWRVTPLRAAVNGVVKTLGAVAAVYAVHPAPPVLFMGSLFLWIFFWEIGGQNIPADWTDIEEDRHFNAKTIPVILGPQRAAIVGMSALVLAFLLHSVVFWASPMAFGAVFLLTAAALNVFLLLVPALHLAQGCQRQQAMNLFNKASYYPLAMLILVMARLALP